MLQVNIHDAKTHFSKYINQVINVNETVVIAKAGVPAVVLTKYEIEATVQRWSISWHDAHRHLSVY